MGCGWVACGRGSPRAGNCGLQRGGGPSLIAPVGRSGTASALPRLQSGFMHAARSCLRFPASPAPNWRASSSVMRPRAEFSVAAAGRPPAAWRWRWRERHQRQTSSRSPAASSSTKSGEGMASLFMQNPAIAQREVLRTFYMSSSAPEQLAIVQACDIVPELFSCRSCAASWCACWRWRPAQACNHPLPNCTCAIPHAGRDICAGRAHFPAPAVPHG